MKKNRRIAVCDCELLYGTLSIYHNLKGDLIFACVWNRIKVQFKILNNKMNKGSKYHGFDVSLLLHVKETSEK